VILIVDCSELGYRRYYTMGKLSYEERQTGIIYGFLKDIFDLAEKFKTTDFGFCWDSRKSYRKDFFTGYKNRNKKNNPEIKQNKKLVYSQLNSLRSEVLPKMGFTNSWILTGLEADDVIANFVMQNPGTIVISSDNDLWQLLDFCDLYSIKNKTIYTKKDFEKEWGIEPFQWIKVKMLSGCVGDTVPGIPGVGTKKAVQFIRNTLPDGKIKEKILSEEGQEIAKRNHKLVCLPFMLKSVVWDNNSKYYFNNWLDVFNKFGFESFKTKKFLGKLKERWELI